MATVINMPCLPTHKIWRSLLNGVCLALFLSFIAVQIQCALLFHSSTVGGTAELNSKVNQGCVGCHQFDDISEDRYEKEMLMKRIYLEKIKRNLLDKLGLKEVPNVIAFERNKPLPEPLREVAVGRHHEEKDEPKSFEEVELDESGENVEYYTEVETNVEYTDEDVQRSVSAIKAEQMKFSHGEILDKPETTRQQRIVFGEKGLFCFCI